jgi:hypothetical protein
LKFLSQNSHILFSIPSLFTFRENNKSGSVNLSVV